MSPLRNLLACVERCHLDIDGIVAAPFAAGVGVLDEDEIEFGAVVIDIGASSTGIAIFCEGSLLHVGDIAIGGYHISKDLSRGLSTPLNHAERIKCLYGSATAASTLERETIVIPIIGEHQHHSGTTVSRSTLTRVIKPRVEELFEHVRDYLDRLGIDKIPGCRVVLTGGSSLLSGVTEVASTMLNRQVRLGVPIHLSGLSREQMVPYLATCTGILSYARLQKNEILENNNKAANNQGVLQSISQWARENL